MCNKCSTYPRLCAGCYSSVTTPAPTIDEIPEFFCDRCFPYLGYFGMNSTIDRHRIRQLYQWYKAHGIDLQLRVAKESITYRLLRAKETLKQLNL